MQTRIEVINLIFVISAGIIILLGTYWLFLRPGLYRTVLSAQNSTNGAKRWMLLGVGLATFVAVATAVWENAHVSPDYTIDIFAPKPSAFSDLVIRPLGLRGTVREISHTHWKLTIQKEDVPQDHLVLLIAVAGSEVRNRAGGLNYNGPEVYGYAGVMLDSRMNYTATIIPYTETLGSNWQFTFVRGFIVDRSYVPIPDAKIESLETHSVYAVTNKRGYFEIPFVISALPLLGFQVQKDNYFPLIFPAAEDNKVRLFYLDLIPPRDRFAPSVK